MAGKFPGSARVTVSPGKLVADDLNDGFRMSLIVGKGGIAVIQALVGRVKPWFEWFTIL